MSYARTTCFSGYCWGLDESQVIVLGAPLEETTSYRPGTRFAPRAIREASAYIEYWSLRGKLDVDEHVRFYDAGDALVEQPLEKALEAIGDAVERLSGVGKPLVVMGGEHTITLGIVEGLVRAGYKPCMVQLDAHMDMRSEYAGRRVSHATFARLVVSEVGVPVVLAGVRGFVREELEFARANHVPVIDAHRLQDESVAAVIPAVSKLIEKSVCNHLHLTLDMDVVDPGFAPGVSNPEPEGITPRILLDIVFEVARLAVLRGMSLSMDVVEVSPPYDAGGVTSVLAAKAIVEFAAGVVAARSSAR
ncbi:agmatinase [Pyrolobus fumarii 1A]|uniref:Agmatinase n=1 Tax=Pyrolobus fumarii (strain DSM 11204 / 1A) TaxID=694429 RepID=G0ED29_PYRF1|nr:agmatinase [Pyrolobus fumarii]AEM38588.1 agmatinase [Pyrolobus fumarii 1A]